MTQKRRVIYLSDEEWAAARAGAEHRSETISVYIGGLVRDAASPKRVVTLGEFPEFRPVPKPSQRGSK